MKSNNYLKFLIADFCSQFGAGMCIAVASWRILEITSSNQAVSLGSNINTLSGLIIAIFAGIIIDRFFYKKIILTSFLLRFLFTFASLLVYLLYPEGIISLYFLYLANGIGWNMYQPASKILLQSISNNDNLLKANSLAETSIQISLFTSGFIASFIYRYTGLPIILIISSILLFVSFLSIYSMKMNNEIDIKSENQEKIPISTSMDEILNFLKKRKFIILLGLILYIPFIAANILNVVIPGYVNQTLNGDSSIYGIITMAYGTGACLAGFIIVIFSKRVKMQRLLISCYLIAFISGVLLVINQKIPIAFLLLMLCGMAAPSIRSIIYSIIMVVIPKKLLGRVISLLNAASLIIQIAVTFVIGLAMDNFGANQGFLVYAGMMLLGVLITCMTRNSLSNLNTICENDTKKLGGQK